MNAETITATMRREGIRNINMAPEWQGSGFTVSLNCGGMPGYGLSFEDALADSGCFGCADGGAVMAKPAARAYALRVEPLRVSPVPASIAFAKES